MIFLDTAVLVYSVGSAHPLREPCRRILDHVQSGRLDATTTPEVIQEFAYVGARRRGRSDVAQLARHFADLLSPLRLTEENHARRALGIWERNAGLGSFDAVLAAVALDSTYATLVSADRGFAEVEGLHHVFPDRQGVAGLVR